MTITRRHFLKQGTTPFMAAAVAPWLTSPAFAQQNMPFGAALYWPDMAIEPRLGPEIARWCQRITPVQEMKFELLRPSEGAWDFSQADALVDYARVNSLAVHGHTLVWYAALPEWVSKITSAAAAEALMTEHIETLMQRYPDITSWDVVNEAIPDVPDGVKSRRDGFWQERLGEDHIAMAFRKAHELSPHSTLVLNEYDVEFADEYGPAKRAAFRDLIQSLLDKGAPVTAIGFQGHLRGGRAIAKDELAAFVAELKSWGLDVLVTELDVIDVNLPRDADERDRVIAAQVRDFLKAIADGGGASSITTWGISDPYSWIRWAYPRPDGTPNRPLPLDENFKPKLFMDVIDDFRNGTL